ncbi:hypothetical protein [Streptomyces sp. NPDC048295]|uniref:hypothetical protein n=1 Tax=Streptomyces sp. NPDC048295 TaxID=3154617 RepID=UPI00343015ED
MRRSRIGAADLEDHYHSSPVLTAVDPLASPKDITDVRRAARLRQGTERSEPLTAAEVAARQIEAADRCIAGALDGALVTDAGLSPGRAGWSEWTDPLSRRTEEPRPSQD